jgi:anthranilate phosphoribosyltransferase
MSLAHYIKQITETGELNFDEAYHLYGAMLDGGVPELELGAIMLATHMRSEAVPELLGFHRALNERVYPLSVPSGNVRPVVFPTYGGALTQPNLLPLIALLLQRFHVPVLLHGTLEGNGRIATAYILRELGVMPCATLTQAQQTLANEGLAFVPTAVLSPGLAVLLSLRSRLGVRSAAHLLAKLIDPFCGEALRVVSASDPARLQQIQACLLETQAHALLLQSTDGEAFANPQRRPLLEYFHEGHSSVLFEAERIKTVHQTAHAIDAHTTAQWIRLALTGEVPLPLPLVNQLACCLYGAGYTQDINQAKAIVAVETGSLTPV